MISDRFDISRGTAYNVFVKTIKTICQLLTHEVKWPSSLMEYTKIMDDFQSSRQNPFPFVIGCVDGMHVKIPIPKIDPVSYYNRKGTHSIIVQVLETK